MRLALNTTSLVTALFLVSALTPGTPWAEAESGFGINLLSANLVSKDSETEQEYGKATFGGGLDYQWALGSAFSLGLAAADFAGDADFPTLPEATAHRISAVELEARFWVNSFFLGYHRGIFVFTTSDDFFKLRLKWPKFSDRVPGGGFSLGLEGDNGWFVVIQTVKASDVQVPEGPQVDVEGALLRLGYRWR